MVDMVDMKA